MFYLYFTLHLKQLAIKHTHTNEQKQKIRTNNQYKFSYKNTNEKGGYLISNIIINH